MSLSTSSSIPFLWSQETEPPTHQLLPSLILLQGEERLVSPMGTQKSLFLHLLETLWRQSSPVIAFERTHPLVLKIGRCFITKGPSGPSAYTTHQQLLHKGCHLVPPAAPSPPRPGSTLQLAPCPPAITVSHLTFQLVAQSLVWRQKEKGDSTGRKKKGLLQALFFLSPLFWCLPLSLSPPLCLYSWQYDRLPAQGGKNSKVSHSHP